MSRAKNKAQRVAWAGGRAGRITPRASAPASPVAALDHVLRQAALRSAARRQASQQVRSPFMTRSAELESLVGSLGRLVDLLRLDSSCQWLQHFETCLRRAQQLLETRFIQASLDELSSSVMSVYGGMGSFNDYAPMRFDPISGRYSHLPGAETFDDVATRVYEDAIALRTSGTVA